MQIVQAECNSHISMNGFETFHQANANQGYQVLTLTIVEWWKMPTSEVALNERPEQANDTTQLVASGHEFDLAHHQRRASSRHQHNTYLLHLQSNANSASSTIGAAAARRALNL